MINTEGGVDYANSLMLEMTGLGREELTEAGIFDTPSWREAGIEAKIRESFEGKHFFISNVEGAFRSGDNTVSVLNVTGVPMQEDGRKKTLLFLEDVTETIKARAVPEEAQEMRDAMEIAATEWRHTFDAMGDMIFLHKPDGTIIRANKAFADAIGHDVKDIPGKKCSELVHWTDSQWRDCPMEKTKKDKKVHSEEVNDPHIGLPLLVTTSPMLDGDGALAAIVHVARDISRIKEAEKKLQEKVHDLELFQRVSVGREIRMIELKKENQELRDRISELEGKNA